MSTTQYKKSKRQKNVSKHKSLPVNTDAGNEKLQRELLHDALYAKKQPESTPNNTDGTPSQNISEGRDSGISNKLESISGSGRPLDVADREFYESRLGQDMNQVRIHTDEKANELAGSVDAKAFTKGNDVVFGKDEYRPNTSSGRRLLAHELVHVLQQNPESSTGSGKNHAVGDGKIPNIQRQPTGWTLDAGKIYSDRAGAVARGRELQQEYTSIDIVEHSPTRYQVRYRNPLPKHTSGFPKDDSGFFYDKPELAEHRANVLRAYGYVVSVFTRPDGKHQCRMTRLMSSAPGLPTTAGFDAGFVFVAKGSADSRAEALKAIGYDVEVRTLSSKNYQVFIKSLPVFSTSKASSKSSPPAGAKPAVKPKTTKKAAAKSGGPPHKLVVINTKDPAKKELSDAVAKSYRDFVAEVKTLTGVDLALNFGDTVRGLAEPTSKTGADTISWHKTGRAVDINQHHKGWVILENPKGKSMYFTLYLKHATPTTKPNPPAIVNFPKTTKFHYYYYPVKPKDAYVNITAIAEKHGWKPIEAQKGWKKSQGKEEWWHFEKRDGLSWYQAIKEIYSESDIVKSIKGFAKGINGANKYGARLKREGLPVNILEKIFSKVIKGTLSMRLPVGATNKSANLAQDVQAVQNNLIKAKYLAGAASGAINAATIAAIKKFQKDKLKISRPDGRIDVGGGTHKELGKVK